jgi:deoxyribodipyrimidine photolyase-related protein
MAPPPSRTVWVLGDQLNRSIGALAGSSPDTTRVLLVEATEQIGGRRYHRQRLHLVLAAMRRFTAECRRRATPSTTAGPPP